MNYKLIIIIILLALVGAVAWTLFESAPQGGVMNGIWQEKFFGQVGASVGRRISVEADVDTAQLMKKGLDFASSSVSVVKFEANGKQLTPEFGVVDGSRIRMVFSDADWVVSFDNAEPFKGTITLKDQTGKEVPVSGMFKRLEADRSGLAPAATNTKK